jgi:hypothetical protein
MDAIGVLPPEQMRELWQWYQSQKQLPAQLTKSFPQRRPIDEVSPHRAFVLNSDTYEAIPPFACMQITGTQIYGGRTVITVEKPTTIDGEYLFNSPYPIEAGKAGWAYRFGVVVMLGQPPSEANVSFQPIIDSWEVEEGGGPFTVFGDYKITPESTTSALIGRFGSVGGGGETMWFTIQEVLCPNDYDVLENTLVVAPLWYTGDCGKNPPGSNGDGTWDVYDFCNYLSGQVFEELIGTTGRATYFYPFTSDPYDPPPCVPRWIISDLCAATECSGGT